MSNLLISNSPVYQKKQVNRTEKIPSFKGNIETPSSQCSCTNEKNTFDWSTASQYTLKGINKQFKNTITSIIQHPLQTAAGVGVISGGSYLAALNGLSGQAIGLALIGGFALLGTAQVINGAKNAREEYLQGHYNKAEAAFEKIGEGCFDLLSIAVPETVGKSVGIIKKSELGEIIAQTKLFKTLNFPTKVFNPIQKGINTSLNEIANTKLVKTLIALPGSDYAHTMSKAHGIKEINRLASQVSRGQDQVSNQVVTLINKVVRDINPKGFIASDTHGHNHLLDAVVTLNPKGKNVYYNGDLVDKGPVNNLPGVRQSSRESLITMRDNLPLAQKNFGNHEVQLLSSTENLGERFYLQRQNGSLTGINKELAELKSLNTAGILTKPSTNFYKDMMCSHGITGEGLEKVGQRLMGKFGTAEFQARKDLPAGQKILQSICNKKNPNKVSHLREVAAKELYRHYSNAGGDLNKTMETFSKLYDIKHTSNEYLFLEENMEGLANLHYSMQDHAKNLHMYQVVKEKHKGDILLTHAWMPYSIEDGKTVLRPEAIIQAEQMAKEGRFTEMLAEKNLSPVWGGEGNGELASFAFDRPDVDSQMIRESYQKMSKLLEEATGEKVNIKRAIIGHETRGGGILDPMTPGWKDDYKHLLKNVDNIELAEKDKQLQVLNKELVQGRMISAYDGQLILADSGIGNAWDSSLGLTKASEQVKFGDDGISIIDGEANRPPDRFRLGSGVMIERDGSLRELALKYNRKGEVFVTKPGKYFYDPRRIANYYDNVLSTINENNERKLAFETLLTRYNKQNNKTYSQEEFVSRFVKDFDYFGKIESKLDSILSRVTNNPYKVKSLTNPSMLLEELITAETLGLKELPVVKATMEVPKRFEIKEFQHKLTELLQKKNGLRELGFNVLDIKATGNNKIDITFNSANEKTHTAQIILKPSLPGTESLIGTGIGTVNTTRDIADKEPLVFERINYPKLAR